ncbi:unnamed protein product [Ascophyllum nodosum]
MLIGAGFWSVYADKYGRRSAFVISLAFVFFGGVISAASPSLLVLCICRVAVGFGVGGNLPVTTALLTEFLPTSHRAHVMCRLAGTFWGVGMLAASGLGLILTIALGPGQEETFWRWFLGMAALPSAVVAVAYNILPESPRFLQVMERHDEALEVLEYVARTNGKLDAIGLEFGGHTSGNSHTALPTSSPDSRASAFEVTYQAKVKQPPGENSVLAGLRDDGGANPMVVTARAADNTKAGDVRDLFHTPILRRVTLCLWVVWLFLNLSYYGVTFLLPVYFAKITGGKRYDEFVLYFLMGITYIPGAWVAMVLCSEYCLGRVGSLKWSSFATAAFIIVMATATDASVVFVVMTLLTMFVIAIPGTIMYLATPELYTTKYRAVGLGSCSVVTRMGGLVAPILAEVLYEKGGAIAPLVVFGPMMIITGVAAALIPIETAGRKLDDDSWDRKTPNLEPMEDAFIVNDVRV